MKSIAISLPLVAALAWTGALVVQSDPMGEVGAMLAGIGLLITAAVAVVGMVVSGGRWSRRLAMVSIGMSLLVAALRPIDAIWIVALSLSGLAFFTMFMPAVTSRIRKLPAAAGPPQAATLIPLILLAVPFLIGVSLGEGSSWAALIVGLAAPLTAFLFSRVIPGGLFAVRVIWPALALSLSPLLAVPAGVLTGALAIGVAILAWRPDVKASFHPPAETGTTYPIPPELTPKDILDEAGLDERGRRR